MTREEFLAKCLTETEKYSKHNRYNMPKEPEKGDNNYTAKKNRIVTLLSRFSYNREELKCIIEELLDDKLPNYGDGGGIGVRFMKYACIVPLANLNSHNYTIGGIYISTSTGGTTLVSPRGTLGNGMDSIRTSSRPANRGEIEEMIEEVDDSVISYLVRH